VRININYIIVLLVFWGCNQSSPKFSIVNLNGGKALQLETDIIDYWDLPYPIYQFQTGDVNNDGHVDAIVGVTKITRFDSTLSNRIFIFKNYKGYVRPLWLGSRLSYPIIDFKFRENQKANSVISLEQQSEYKYLVNEYKWYKFGLQYQSTIANQLDYEIAIKVFENN
jgi:hypothetical protein